jgi:hypothetical protein
VPHPLPVCGDSPWFFSLELGMPNTKLLLPVIPLEASCGRKLVLIQSVRSSEDFLVFFFFFENKIFLVCCAEPEW